MIFVKEPRPGRVKTRLARGLGPVAAAGWFRREAQRLLRRVGGDPRWRTVLAVSPDAEGLASRVWPRHMQRRPQGPGDLGARMARAMRSAPPGPVLVIGADIPELSPRHVARAFGRLGERDAVLGPASDGGFWAIGLRRGRALPPASLLRGVRWSSPHTMSDTLRSLAPLSVGFADTLADVDTVEDLASPAAARRA